MKQSSIFRLHLFGDSTQLFQYFAGLTPAKVSVKFFTTTIYIKNPWIPGVIYEFGIQWGTTMAQQIAMRGICVSYTHSREICGFDTFEDFTVIDKKDQGFS